MLLGGATTLGSRETSNCACSVLTKWATVIFLISSIRSTFFWRKQRSIAVSRFKRLVDGAAVLVVASGASRVDEAKVTALVGPIGKADAKFVKERTGYAIGGVCPIGHAFEPVILLDQGLFALESLWAAAGHPHAVFNLTPQQLQAMTGAPVVDVSLQV